VRLRDPRCRKYTDRVLCRLVNESVPGMQNLRGLAAGCAVLSRSHTRLTTRTVHRQIRTGAGRPTLGCVTDTPGHVRDSSGGLFGCGRGRAWADGGGGLFIGGSRVSEVFARGFLVPVCVPHVATEMQWPPI
jgi:hypothetical protein